MLKVKNIIMVSLSVLFVGVFFGGIGLVVGLLLSLILPVETEILTSFVMATSLTGLVLASIAAPDIYKDLKKKG